MPGIQEWIHSLEEGKGAAILKRLVFFLAVLALGVWYNVREYRNFSTAEMMDAAQIARNISQGEGFTTDYIRPFSVALLRRHHGEVNALTNAHPDLMHGPVYPALLAGALKVAPVSHQIGESDLRYAPEVAITVFNQLLFAGVVVAAFMLARRLFDDVVAWATAILLIGNALLWEFTNTGTPTILMMLVFLLAVICLVRMEARSREEPPGGVAGWAALAGLLIGIGCLTRYSFGFLLIPAAVFMGSVLRARSGASIAIMAVVFAIVVGPWVARNMAQSGTPFGIAGYSVFERTPLYPKNRLERSLPRNFETDLKGFELRDYTRKLIEETADVLNQGLAKTTGSLAAALFLAALLIRFNNPALQRLKWLIVGMAATLLVVQALGRTEWSDTYLTSENLVVLLAPLLLMFGAAMFFILLDQMDIVSPQLRRLVVGAFLTVGCAGLILKLLPPRTFPVAWPPYLPSIVQHISGWMKESEVMMSDIPWAVAWYGDRKCLLTTMDAGDTTPSDFFYLNDYQKPIQGLYLSPATLDSKFTTEMLKSPDGAWGRFVLEALMRTNVPATFPLKQSPRGMLPEHLFLSDRNRWGR